MRLRKRNLEPDLEPVRVVLLGFTGSGKRSSQNTILGLGPPLSRHKKAEGVVAGRPVTVVDTPGWYRTWPVLQTSELVRKEIEYSVFQCLPGPHAFLLVVNVDAPFRERDRRSMVEHIELLGAGVWRHTLLLFTYGDWLQDASIEEHLASEGDALRWLVEKCGNRYHVLSNVLKGDGSQVTQLLDKIDKMVAGNREQAFYQVNVDVVGTEEDEEKGREEEDWTHVWEMKTENFRKINSIEFPPPSFGSEDRRSSGSLRTSKSRRTKFTPARSSGYGSQKWAPRCDCSSEGSWASRSISEFI